MYQRTIALIRAFRHFGSFHVGTETETGAAMCVVQTYDGEVAWRIGFSIRPLVAERVPVLQGRDMKGVVRTIVFDRDRTFLDSVPAGYNASVTVLRHFGIEVDRKRFLETYGPNWYDSYRMLGVPEEGWHPADRLSRETSHQQMSALFPFVTTMLHLMGILAIFSDRPGTVTHYASPAAWH